MRRFPLAPAVAALFLASGCALDPLDEEPAPEPEHVDLAPAVDPRISTGGVGFGIGSGYPGPAMPFAMIHPGPDTTNPGGALSAYHCSGYNWDDSLVRGFSLTRMHGTGLADYGTIAFMPVDGIDAARTTEAGYQAGFDHADEPSSPGYYSVLLSTGIRIEITSTLRASVFRFTFPDGSDPTVLVDPLHTLSGMAQDARAEVDPVSGIMKASVHMSGEMSGRFGGFDAFAHARFEPLPSAVGTWDATGLHDGAGAATGTPAGAYARFASGTSQVLMRVGLSFVDAAGAASNLAAEASTGDFDGVRDEAQRAWDDEVSRIEVWGAPERDVTMLATAMYHAHLMPTLMTDVDGRMVDTSGRIVKAAGARYSDFSLWDTYRTLHPPSTPGC